MEEGESLVLDFKIQGLCYPENRSRMLQLNWCWSLRWVNNYVYYLLCSEFRQSQQFKEIKQERGWMAVYYRRRGTLSLLCNYAVENVIMLHLAVCKVIFLYWKPFSILLLGKKICYS